LRFYDKTEVPLPPSYLGIGFWLDGEKPLTKFSDKALIRDFNFNGQADYIKMLEDQISRKE